MNRREFIKLTGAVGTLAVTATVPRFVEALEAAPHGNVEFKGVLAGSNIWIGTVHGVTLWTGTAVGGRLFGQVPTEFNGDEIIIRIRKAGYREMLVQGQSIPADDSGLKLSAWQVKDEALSLREKWELQG